ncbi:MAG: diguanylate cyclase, partial [Nitrospiraceae bacterium]|nr:diguanylate cyclase [Nitrospiraceae bacterium]
VLDIHGFVVDTSAWFPQCLGYEHAEMEGLHVSSFDVRWSLSELSDIVQRIASLPPGETAVVETVYRRTDGVLIPVRLNTRSLKVGDELFLFRSTQDLSRGSISESRFRQLSRLNILLATSGAAVFEARDEATFLQAFCDLVVRHGEMSLAWVGRPGSDGLFRVQAAAGMRAYLEDIRISVNEGVPEGDGPVGAAFRQNRPFFNNDFDAPFLRPWKDRARSLGIRSNAVFPIWHEDQVWGIFAVYHDDREAFPEEVQASLFELSRTLTRGLALVATRRKEKETALLQEALLENTLAAIALVREESFVSGNARFHEMFGMRNDTLPRCSPNDLFVDERATRAICRPFEGSSDQEVRLFSDILVRKLDGREFHVDLSARHLAGTQTTVWTVGDVSERHALQEKNIRLSQFNLMLARANQAIATFSEEHALLKELCILAVETGGMDLAGIGVPDANGWLEIRASAGKESFLEGVRYSVREEALEGRGSVGLAWRTRTSQFAESFSPTSFWKERARQFGFRSGGALPVLRNGKPWGVFFVYYRKEKILLTEFKDILEELVSNVSRGLDLFELQGFHSLLSRALAVVSDGAVITGKDQKVCFSNRAFSEISGFPLEEVIGQDCRKLSGHSRDPRGVGEVDRAIESGQPFEGEVLSYRKDGTPFWNHLSITPIKNESGVLTHFLEIHRDVTHVRQMAERLAFESRHDELTGLPNRRSLESHLERVLARAGRHGQTVAVGVLDLNNFKPVNDLHGHEAGDVLLKEFSWRVRTKLRESDFIARLGGDEFVLVIDDLLRPVSEETLGTFLERIHEGVETPFLLPSGKSAMVGMSLGIALFPEDGREGNELLRKADFSMYRVKDRKRRQISWWQRGAEEDRAETEHPIDPFGPETIALLSEHKEELERFQEGFVESFYRELEESPDARSVLGALSQEERASLKLRQGQYLKG